MRPSNANPPSGASRSEGPHQATQQGDAEFGLLGTDATTFAAARKLKAELIVAAAAQPPDLEACAALWGEWRSVEGTLSPAAAAYRNAVDLAKLECDERVWHARASYADAEFQAKRSGTGPADEAWAIYRAECRQAADEYAAAVTRARATYLAQPGRICAEPHLAESFDLGGVEAAMRRAA